MRFLDDTPPESETSSEVSSINVVLAQNIDNIMLSDQSDSELCESEQEERSHSSDYDSDSGSCATDGSDDDSSGYVESTSSLDLMDVSSLDDEHAIVNYLVD